MPVMAREIEQILCCSLSVKTVARFEKYLTDKKAEMLSRHTNFEVDLVFEKAVKAAGISDLRIEWFALIAREYQKDKVYDLLWAIVIKKRLNKKVNVYLGSCQKD